MSRDTAYRLFSSERSGDRKGHAVTDAIICSVAEASTDPEWSGAAESQSRVAATFFDRLDEGGSPEDPIREALAANLHHQFESPGHPAGWMLQAAAFTASPRWRGELRIKDEDRSVAEGILEQRKVFYAGLTEQYMALMREGMSQLRIRPRPGITAEQIVVLMHCLLDGAVLRLTVDPDAVTDTQVVDAMLAVALAFAEPGANQDPRRPEESLQRAVFDRVVHAAERQWREGAELSFDSLPEVGDDVSTDTIAFLFPTRGDLADSVLRALISGGGRSDAGDGLLTLSHLTGALRRLAEAADTVAGAVTTLLDEGTTRGSSIIDDLTVDATDVIGAGGMLPSSATARKLVELALKGLAAWPAIEAILDLAGS